MVKLRTDRPGYQYSPRADGSRVHYWNPCRASKQAPKKSPVRRIDQTAISEWLPDEPDLSIEDAIPRLCQQWTDQLLADLETKGAAPVYDGTIASVILLYRTDPESPYHALKHSSRVRDYDPALRLIRDTVGKRQVALCKGEDFRRWFNNWHKKGHRTAHGAMRKLRTVLSYGVTERLPGCSVAREILSLIRFKAPASRSIKMEYSHALAICDKAIELKRPSIALTQALQWDTGLRRIHIIGEWLPVGEDDAGGIVKGNSIWRGLTVADISSDMVLTVPKTSKNKAATRHDLKECPLVQHVLTKVSLPRIGPLIVSEISKSPYWENYYARDWRTIAEAAEVPGTVWSADTRAGAISEAEEATGSLDRARKFAGHTNAKTTLGYVRNDDLTNNRIVAAARSNLRQ